MEQAIPITADMTMRERIDAQNYNTAMAAKNKEINQRRVLVSPIEFKIDAYSAAISGILQSVRLGLESPSLGQGAEVETLRAVWNLLVERDEALAMEPRPWEE